MDFSNLFFTLLLYRKVKTHQYRFYDCLVSHDGAYLDLNRLVEPTDTLTVTYKIFLQDAVEDAWRSHVGGLPTQQFIVCARTTYLDENHVEQMDPNTVLVTPFPFFSGASNWDGTPHSILGNGTTLSGQNLYYDFGENAFDKKVTVTIKQTSSDIYVHNTEKLISPIKGNRHLVEGWNRALLKLFAGFYWSTGQLVLNGCDSRIYSFYIQNANDEYTMRLQPAEDLSTGELGMYDAINDKFYPNKNSVGYFTVEEDITDKIVLDVESQIDTKRLSVYCTSYNMPYRLSDGKLMLVKKHNLPPVIDGFIDLWDGMGKQSDEEGIFNHVTLERNQTGEVTYTDNGDGSITISATSASADYSHWAYKLTGAAVGSIVLVGTCGGTSTNFFVVMNYTGSTPSNNGSFRWYVDDGRKQQYVTEDYEDAAINSIYTASNPHTYTAAGLSDITANGNTLIGATYNGSTTLTIYGMALYDRVLTKAQLLEVAHWADQYIKRPQATTRSTENS